MTDNSIEKEVSQGGRRSTDGGRSNSENEEPLKKSELLTQLGNAINLRNDEHQTWLNVFFISLTTNALLFIALFASGSFPKNPIIGFFLAFFGASLTSLLSRVQTRALFHMQAHEKFARKIEKSLQSEEFSYTKNLDHYLADKKGEARPLMKAFNYCLIALWLLMAFVFLAIYLFPEILDSLKFQTSNL